MSNSNGWPSDRRQSKVTVLRALADKLDHNEIADPEAELDHLYHEGDIEYRTYSPVLMALVACSDTDEMREQADVWEAEG